MYSTLNSFLYSKDAVKKDRERRCPMNPLKYWPGKAKEIVKTIDVESLPPEELYRQLSKGFLFISIKH